ncbi:Magnesium transport protein CorA [Rubripirellula obstinata]|uniref:Magnesium transport protein CorA n=1 Tax=Rubripirellula obstinata TaxID=406547 RepID=A0A5B1CDG6_9BACT|nr:magnesium/cobalt transporter CorA [Rubripirellula obstinata]KAA1259208.1 Magnesium transport protein CorA [Rubripirellula obstinata]
MPLSRFKKRHTKVGARPGTLVIPKDAAKPTIRSIHYHLGGCDEADVVDIDNLHETFKPDTVTWVDVQGFGDRKVMQKIGKVFGLHSLLLEDIVNVPQRPKTEPYGDQLLMVVRMVQLEKNEDTRSVGVDMEQISIVLAKNYVITFQEKHGDVLDPVRARIRSGKGVIRTHGADYLAYAIADTIIDCYYPVLESVGDKLESLENDVIHNPTPAVLQELNAMKNQLINLRRAIWPQREAINSLVRGDHNLMTEPVGVYLRDTYDHCIQTSEVAEMYREMVTGLMNTYLSSIANRTNEVMKVLTIMASIFIPLTFMAGIYGMNFEHMPELHYRYSYAILWAAMLAVGGGMIAYFWKKGWIGK